MRRKEGNGSMAIISVLMLQEALPAGSGFGCHAFIKEVKCVSAVSSVCKATQGASTRSTKKSSPYVISKARENHK